MLDQKKVKDHDWSENNDIANAAYSIFCMFSQLSKEETKGYDCDEMWFYCHDLYSAFCDSEFNDDNISEIDAMNKFLKNIEERIAWCKYNPPLTNEQRKYRVYASTTTKSFVDINATDYDDAIKKGGDVLKEQPYVFPNCIRHKGNFIKIDSPPPSVYSAEQLEDEEVSHA